MESEWDDDTDSEKWISVFLPAAFYPSENVKISLLVGSETTRAKSRPWTSHAVKSPTKQTETWTLVYLELYTDFSYFGFELWKCTERYAKL